MTRLVIVAAAPFAAGLLMGFPLDPKVAAAFILGAAFGFAVGGLS